MQNKRTPVEKMLDTLTAQDAELAALRAELADALARTAEAEACALALSNLAFQRRDDSGHFGECRCDMCCLARDIMSLALPIADPEAYQASIQDGE